MKSGNGFFLTICLWFYLGSLCAQPNDALFEFRHIQESQGLAANFVNCLLQDRNGFLWIGTLDGLNRYDGRHFVTFKRRPPGQNGILHNAVHALCEAPDGVIWMAVQGGISGYNTRTGQFRNITQAAGKDLGYCNNIVCDRHGVIWFSSRQDGLFSYQPQTGVIRSFPYQAANPLEATTGILAKRGLVLDPNRNGLWLATHNGVSYFDISQHQFIDYRFNPQKQAVFAQHVTSGLTLDGSERLLFSDNVTHQIVIYNLKNQTIERTITPVSQTRRNVFPIATIFTDRQHNIWTSSWNNVLFYIESATNRTVELFHQVAKPTSIAANFYWAAWQHPDGSVWLGTNNGISYTNPQRSLYTIYDLSLLFPELTDERGILKFQEDSDGSWWLGTSIRGLVHYFPKQNKLDVFRLPDATATYPYGLPIHGIIDLGSTLCIGTQNAIFFFDKQTRQFSPLPLPDYVRGKYLQSFTRQGDLIWVAGAGKDVFCYNLVSKRWQAFPIPSTSTDPRFQIRFSLVDRRGDFWVELYPEGLAHFSRQKNAFERIDVPQLLPYETTLVSLDQDRSGAFWMASNGYGLFRYNPHSKEVTNWTENQGLAYDYCGSALPDRFGNIWVGAYNKISVFSTSKNRFLNLVLLLNEQDIEYTTYLFPLRNGHILSAQKGNLVEFRPEKLALPYAKEHVLISSLSIADTTYLLQNRANPIRLAATNNAFSVQYSVLAPPNGLTYHYQYKLEGYDEHWIDEPSWAGMAVYGKLPGGKYLFCVKAIDAKGVETPISSLPIYIDTLFYKSPWFWMLISLVVAGLLYVFIRYRAQQTAKLHHLHLQATRLERDKAEIHYQNLINHLNPHFLFNSLTSLNSLIISKPKDASVFLRKLSFIYRYILQNKDKELVSLQDELTFAQNYIALQESRFGEALQINIRIDDRYLTRQIVPVTIQNLLENAIKHNVLSDEDPLTIQIYTADETLFVVNSLQKKVFVETSHKQGLASLKSVYHYLGTREVIVTETDSAFTVAIPLFSAPIDA
ncbi:ligand-binding sensor domain-containing protein [Spirosoma gilvum]